jgi:hypothetical protein
MAHIREGKDGRYVASHRRCISQLGGDQSARLPHDRRARAAWFVTFSSDGGSGGERSRNCAANVSDSLFHGWWPFYPKTHLAKRSMLDGL